MQQLTQHRIPSFGDMLDLVRTGNQTSLESVEFDISVGPDGTCEIGHPVDLVKRGAPAISAEKFLQQLARLRVKQIVIDVKARIWNVEKGRAEFHPHDQEKLYTELPRLIQTYRQDVGAEFSPQIIVASVNEEFFEDMSKIAVPFGEGVRTRFFARNTSENPFAEALRLHVDEVGIEFLKNNSDTRLQQLHSLAAQSDYRDLRVSFYTVDNPATAEQIARYFPEAEIITNQSSRLEQEQKKEQSVPELTKGARRW